MPLFDLANAGNLAPGDMLPTQAELAAAAGVSLITVRPALEELERAGQVRRHQGVGTFLARPRIISEPGRSGRLLDALRRAHDAGDAEPAARGEPRVGNRLLSLGQGLPSVSLRAALQLADGAPAWEIRRQRLVNGEPKVYETAVIPVALAPGLDCFTQVYPALEFGFYISGGTSRRLLRTTSWDGWGVTAAPVRSEEK